MKRHTRPGFWEQPADDSEFLAAGYSVPGTTPEPVGLVDVGEDELEPPGPDPAEADDAVPAPDDAALDNAVLVDATPRVETATDVAEADETDETDEADTDEADQAVNTVESPAGRVLHRPTRRRPAHRGRRSKTMRRLTGAVALLFALLLVGFLYTAFAPGGNTATAATAVTGNAKDGESLYNVSCITCHGANLSGVTDRGPSLIGVGQAAVYFQLATGRMPATAQAAEMARKDPVFDAEQIADIGAYIQSMGGGPTVDPTANLQNQADLSQGAELYRLNCASCHNFTGRGGALSQGKYAPALDEATDAEIYAAMLSGPENMPKFSDAQLTPEEKVAIITYIQDTNNTLSPGGYDLGGFGPAPEGLVAFLVGMGLIVGITLWKGSRT